MVSWKCKEEEEGRTNEKRKGIQEELVGEGWIEREIQSSILK